MRYHKVVVWLALAGVAFVAPALSDAAEAQAPKASQPPAEGQAVKKESDARMPVYKPPLRGTPRGRIGGGTRGEGGDAPLLAALSPDHTGLTGKEQPVLHWYLSKVTPAPIELAIISEQSIHPIFEVRLDPSGKPGVQQFRLADHGVRLSPGVKYEWFVALVLDPQHRSKDIITGGVIERVEVPTSLSGKLAKADRAEAPYLYASAGFWYDALSAVSELIDAAPNDLFLRRQRASLLEQVGLPEIARYDLEHATTR